MARKPANIPQTETEEQFRKRVVDIVCDEIAHSDRSLWDICNVENGLVNPRTFADWVVKFDDINQQYARAKTMQADFMAAQIRQLADECRIGQKITQRGDVTETVTADMVERSRLQIDARKWLASKLAPKKYGEKVDHTIGNPDGTPLDLTVNFVAVENSTK